MHTTSLRHVTVKRKAALLFAICWVIAFLFLFAPTATKTPPALWHPWAVILAVSYSAYAGAVFLVEILRLSTSRFGIRNDATHFRWVMIASLPLVAIAAVVCWWLSRAHG